MKLLSFAFINVVKEEGWTLRGRTGGRAKRKWVTGPTAELPLIGLSPPFGNAESKEETISPPSSTATTRGPLMKLGTRGSAGS